MNTALRHPILKLGSPHLVIYKQIEKNPNCTRSFLAKRTTMDKNTISRRTAELKNAGLVVETGRAYDEEIGRKVATLAINKSMEAGSGNKSIEVTLYVFMDYKGAYEVMTAAEATFKYDKPIAVRKVKLSVPSNPNAALQTSASKDVLTLEGDYQIIEA